MAKKRRLIKEEPEEEYSFTPTDFDEREFLLKGIYSTKVMLLSILLAVVVAVVAAVIWSVMDDSGVAAIIDTIIVFVVLLVMKKLFVACNVRADLLETKTMLGNYLVYLILALGACILFVNAPFLG